MFAPRAKRIEFATCRSVWKVILGNAVLERPDWHSGHRVNGSCIHKVSQPWQARGRFNSG